MSKRVRLRYQRLAAELARSQRSQNAWALKLDISPAYLSQMLNGRRLYPGPEIQHKLVRVLGIPFDELFTVESDEEGRLTSKGNGSESPRPVFHWEGRRFQVRITRSKILDSDEAERGSAMPAFLLDFRLALRSLFKRPGFTLATVLTLSLGIGVNIAMFSILDGVLLRPLSYPEPDQLVVIRTRWNLPNEIAYGSLNLWEYFDLQERTGSFQGVGAYEPVSVNLSDGEGEVERVGGVKVTASLFQVLGVRPALGREMKPEETFSGAQPVVFMSERLWKRRFGGDPGILGRSLRILSDSYQVIGILPSGFVFPHSNTDLWLSYGIDRDRLGSRGARYCSILARLHSGVTLQQAQADMDVLAEQLGKEFPTNYPEGSDFGFSGILYRDTIIGSVRSALLILMGAVGLVLLIACANLTNLLLVHVKSREKEIAIRSALGAGRFRIVCQILSESLLLCLLGGIGAAGTAWGVFQGLTRLFPERIPRLKEVGLDLNVWLFSLGLIVLVALAIGLIPALQGAGSGLQQTLQEGGRSPSSGGRFKTRATLVVSEVALSVVLLVAAGLLLRSLQQLLEVNPGFEAGKVLTTEITLPPKEYPDHERRALFYQRLIEQIAAQPGILSAAAVNILPLSGYDSDYAIEAEGYLPPKPDAPDYVQYRVVSPDYFKTMGIPVLEGRSFTDQDRTGSLPVAIISQSLARRYWGEESAVGKRVLPGGPGSTGPWHTVVGVVGDIYHRGAREGEVPTWYRSLYQDSWRSSSLAVRTRSDPQQAVGSIRSALREIDPQIPIHATRSGSEMVSESLVQERFNTTLLLVFAGLALLLSGIGIFGVISYSVSQRTREIGVRMAMGASESQILCQMLGEGARLVSLGLTIGVLSALAISRVLSGLLFGVPSWDPLTYLAIVALLLATGLAACWGPAARATRVDPMVALRGE